jgi:hypothetical protein
VINGLYEWVFLVKSQNNKDKRKILKVFREEKNSRSISQISHLLKENSDFTKISRWFETCASIHCAPSVFPDYYLMCSIPLHDPMKDSQCHYHNYVDDIYTEVSNMVWSKGKEIHGFLKLYIINIWAPLFFVMKRCPVQGRLFSSIPVLY